MPSYGLYECPQIRSGHTEHKRPVFLRVQVGVCQDEEALVRLRRELVSHNHIKQVLGVELLPLSIESHTSLQKFVNFQVLKV